MERLTHKARYEAGYKLNENVREWQAIDRLAAYEDTGLTPDEITDGKMLTGWIPVDERLPKLDEDGYACRAWNIGSIHNTNVTNCVNYEIVKDSNAYFLGVRSAEDDAYSRGCLAGIELGKKEALCEITPKTAKSMICTLDMFKRLAFNVHGVIDVIDDRNIERMREILSNLN